MSQRTSHLSARLASAGLLAGIVGMALTLMPATAVAKAGDPHYHQPTAGECHDYTYDQMLKSSETSAPVDCATVSHTAKITKVTMLPDGVSYSDTAKLGNLVANRCQPAWEALLGRTDLKRALTAYSQAAFIPTKAERSQGARWLRCDVILWRGVGLAPLPYDTAPLVSKPLTDSIRRCLKAKTFYVTTCSSGHAFRATGDFRAPKGPYPTEKRFARIAQNRCPSLVSSQTWRYTWPSKAAWKQGYRVMVCYSKTTN